MAEAVEIVVLIIVGLVIGIVLAFIFLRNKFSAWRAKYELEHQERFDQELERVSTQKLNGSRYALRGQIAEKLAPLAPEFLAKYDPSDAHFLGMPIDHVIFKNLSKRLNGENEPIEIVFVEVKMGRSQLTGQQPAIRDAIDNLRVKFETLRLAKDQQAF
jgi:predicted Holliday junction resolvase-like endonuclease